jgi:hypothetical protein
MSQASQNTSRENVCVTTVPVAAKTGEFVVIAVQVATQFLSN